MNKHWRRAMRKTHPHIVIDEQDKRIAEQDKRIAELEAKIDRLTSRGIEQLRFDNAELEAELEKAALRESNAVAFEIRTQSELQSAHQERDRLLHFYTAVKALHDDPTNDEIDRDIGVIDLLAALLEEGE